MRTIRLSEKEYKAMNVVITELLSQHSYLGEKFRSIQRTDSHRFYFFSAVQKLRGAAKHGRYN